MGGVANIGPSRPTRTTGSVVNIMDINDRLFVEIVPLTHGQIPRPHPIDDARFDPALIYKVLGMYNPSETSECYFVLVNPNREIWFIPQRHVRAFGLLDSDEMFLPPPTKPGTGRLFNGSNGHSSKASDVLPVSAL